MTHHASLAPKTASAPTEMETLFALQRKASRADPPAPLELRRDRLQRLRSTLVQHEAAFIRAIADDFGTRAEAETRMLEILPTLSAIRQAVKKLPGWMRPERRSVDPAFLPGRAWVRHEPLGVVGIISPWNYPLQLALSPLVDAIAAGNRVMIKPSELTPAFSALLRDRLGEAFDPAEVAAVTGGVETGEAFSSLPFDHLLFTGSTAVGRKVYQAAAANLTPVTLELGGKSPAILLDDFSLDRAARSIAFGKWVNAGQTCIAPDYVLVPADKLGALAERLMIHAQRSYPRVADNPDYSAIISQRHYDRLTSALADAEKAGAKILRHQEEGAAQRRKIGPTVVIGAPESLLLLEEEIFGPILPLIPYTRIEEAIAFVAARERPLALYCFTDNRRHREHLLGAILSGGVTLNGTLLHVAQEDLPFGGVGPSGLGAYHGREGFRRFSHARGVFKVGRFNIVERIGPPWGKAAAMVSRLLARR